MKKKVSLMLCLMIAGSLVFSGCGKNDSSDLAGMLDDGAGTGQEEGSGDEAASDAGEEKSESRFKKSGQAPVFLRHRGTNYEHNKDGRIAIDHKYSYFVLDEGYSGKHKELADKLISVKDEILTAEKRKMASEKKMLKEDDLYAFEEAWGTYVRRADNNILSFVTEYVAVGEFDGQYYTEYTSHNFYTDTGDEIKLSDIVKDEDAFYDLLAARLKEYFDYAKKNVYAIDADVSADQIKEDVKGYLDQGSCAWTLDPDGVTFFLNAYTGLPEGVSGTVRFSDDKDGKIFNEDFADDAREEWIIQVPEHIGCYIDIDDNGSTEYVSAYPTTDLREFEGSEEYYVSGLHVGVDGEIGNFKTVMEGGTSYYDIYLAHKDGKTVLFEYHDEYDTGFIFSYTLGKDIAEADALRGAFEWSEDDRDPDSDVIFPHYVPIETDNIRVLKEEDDEARDMTPDILSIDEDGKMELDSGDFQHFKRSEDDGNVMVEVGKMIDPFYGVWVGSFKDRAAAVDLYDKLKEKSFDPQYVYSVEWDNLSKDPYYCVTAGMCKNEEEAKTLLEDVKKAGYKDAYVKFTGERTGHRIYYVVYSEDSLEISPDEVILNDVQIEELSGGYGEKANLTINKDTVFDENCDTSFFGLYEKGQTPLEWINKAGGVLKDDPDAYSAAGMPLKGVFEVSITGNHVDRFYGSYWWD